MPLKSENKYMQMAGRGQRPKYKRPKRTKEEIAEAAANRKYDRERREDEKRHKTYVKSQRFLAKLELSILEYMKKTDVLDYHHNTTDSRMKEIDEQIAKVKRCLKEGESYCQPRMWPEEYDSYIWNRQGEGNNYMWRSLLHCIWSHKEFVSHHDVPLDGTYIFHTYDRGERGCGSYHGITCHKVDDEAYVPKVSPGSFPPITSL